MQRRLVLGLLALGLLGTLGLLSLRQVTTRGRPGVHESPYRGSDPALLAATGRPQLVEFFHHAWLNCRAMAPIVHGLEKEWSGRVDFLYLDIADSASTAAKVRLGFRATPHFFMLDHDGLVRGEWQGIVERDTLVRALDAIVRDNKRANLSEGRSSQ